jgi:hypothetical protein
MYQDSNLGFLVYNAGALSVELPMPSLFEIHYTFSANPGKTNSFVGFTDMGVR